MSQFMLIERNIAVGNLSDVLLSEINSEDEFLREVATKYFSNLGGCRLATDMAGRGEPLVDDVCDAQQRGNPIEGTTFVRFLRLLVEARVEFICWQGSDYHDLPTVRTWSEVMKYVQGQTNMQPADLYLHFIPACTPTFASPSTPPLHKR